MPFVFHGWMMVIFENLPPVILFDPDFRQVVEFK
jgi:hypothetical protein